MRIEVNTPFCFVRKKFFPILLGFQFLFVSFAIGQMPGEDCCTAEPLYPLPIPPAPTPAVPIPPKPDQFPCGCIEEESATGSSWIWFSATVTGTLEMVIVPSDPDSDFDFALFSACGCEPPENIIACDSEPIDPNSNFTGIADDPKSTFGIEQTTGFAPTVTLEAGNNYWLFVDNVSEDGAPYTVDFAGTTALDAPILDDGPEITGPTTVCPGATTTYSASLEGAIMNSWLVSLSPTIIENTITEELTVEWPETPGSYELCVRSIRQCADTYFSCITVDVEPIPVGAESDVICSGTFYYDGNGNAYSNPGTYTVTYESEYGCDSVVLLNLEVAPSEFIVTAELKCEGDCVVFDGQTICESGTYEKTYINQFGCDSTRVLNYVAVPTESVIEGLDTLSCKKTSFELDGSMSLGGDELTFEWVFDDEVVGTEPTLTVTEGGTYTLVTKSVVGPDTCVAEASVEIITDLEAPENVTASGGEISCLQSAVTLMANSSSPDVIYQWDGPGFQSSEQNPTTTVAGEYMVTVTGLNGCTSTRTVEVTGNTEEPEASGTGGAITCDDETVTLMGNSSIPSSSFVWVSQLGPVFNEQNPVVEVATEYTLTVTAPNGCTGTFTVTVEEDNEIPDASAGEAATLNCFASELVLNGTGSSNGSTFNYLWTSPTGNIVSGESTLTPTVDQAGTYSILVTDTDNGCTNTASVEISQTPPLSLEISEFSNANCFGEATGSATAFAGGGDEDYIFQWSNGESMPTANGLAAGSYSVTVTDGEGCSETTSVTIEEPPVLELSVAVTGQTAVGVNDGTANATPTGGTPNYSYEWSNGAMTASITGLAPGNYSVTITDENGCTAVQSVTVSEFDCVVKAEIDHTDVTCQGFDDGTATVELDGASTPVVYAWSNGGNTETIEDLAPGTYTVTAVDDNGCEVVASATIMEPASLSPNATANAETGAGANDGTATADPTGGNSPFSFEWSNGEMTQSIEGLAPGIYTVTVTDDNGCQSVQEVTVFSFGCQIVSDISFSHPSCAGISNGQATITLIGGLAPFDYEWSNGGETPTIEDLSGGTYSVTVIDDGGCEVIDEVTLEEPPAISIEIVSQMNSGCGVNTGSATVSAEGGTGTLTYLWPSGETSPSEDELAPGLYQVSVSDENDCEQTLDVTIGAEDVNPPSVFTNDIEVILDEMGNATILTSDIDNGSFDDCEITEIGLDITSFDCSDIGANTVTLTASDMAGNSAQATAQVTVVDNTPPMLETTTVTLGLTINGTATLPPGILVVSSSDNCGPVTLDAFPTEFTCDDLGENIVTLTATDPSGNQTVQEVTVNIVDEVNPTINCPDNLEAPYCDAVVEYEIGYSDNCAVSGEAVLVEGLPSGSTFPQGQTTVVYEVIDESGNAATCEFTVSVTDEMSSSNVVIIDETGTNMNGSIDVTILGGNSPFSYQWTDEDGNVISNDEDIDGLSSGEYTLQVTDENGCIFEMTYFVDMVSSSDENNLEDLLRIYPNPTSGIIYMDIPDNISNKINVVIYDIVGHTLENRNISNNGKHIFDISKNPSGVYLLKIISGENTVSKRFILSK